MSESRVVRVGCRGTDFCRAQTAKALVRLAEAHPDITWNTIDIDGGANGAILEALAAGVCDLHVRGAREVPLSLPDGVILAACAQRIDPFDVLIARDGVLLEDLPEGARVGVESSRVAVQLASFREDLKFEKMEGTVDLFMASLEAGEIAAFVAAAEDVEMLGWEGAVSEVFPPDMVLPAAGQGASAFLVRAGDEDHAALVRGADHQLTHQIVRAERAVLRELAVRSTDPVAAHGSFEGEGLVLEAMLADEVSGAILRDDLDGEPEEEGDLGARLAKLLLADGARDYLVSYK